MGSQKIFLGKAREAAVAASGKTLTELIDLGLGVALQEADLESAQPALAHTARASQRREDCKHPPARRAKGLCMACGTYAG